MDQATTSHRTFLKRANKPSIIKKTNRVQTKKRQRRRPRITVNMELRSILSMELRHPSLTCPRMLLHELTATNSYSLKNQKHQSKTGKISRTIS